MQIRYRPSRMPNYMVYALLEKYVDSNTIYSGKSLACKHLCRLKCSQSCDEKLCTICRAAEYAKYKVEQELIATERKRLKEEALEEARKIREQYEKDPPKSILRTVEDVSLVNYLGDLVSKFVQPDHRCALEVLKIKEVINPPLRAEYVAFRAKLFDPEPSSRLLFHGTGEEGVNGIVSEGFRLPSRDNKNMFGCGIYFAVDSSKSAQTIYTKGSNTLLLCDVWLGKTHTYEFRCAYYNI